MQSQHTLHWDSSLHRTGSEWSWLPGGVELPPVCRVPLSLVTVAVSPHDGSHHAIAPCSDGKSRNFEKWFSINSCSASLSPSGLPTRCRMNPPGLALQWRDESGTRSESKAYTAAHLHIKGNIKWDFFFIDDLFLSILLRMCGEPRGETILHCGGKEPSQSCTRQNQTSNELHMFEVNHACIKVDAET